MKKKIFGISSNELLLREEKIRQLHQQAEKEGFGDRRSFVLDEKQDQAAMLNSVETPSLFASKTLVEIKCRQEQLTKETEGLLAELVTNTTEEVFVIIALPYLTKAQRKRKAIALLERHGQLVMLYAPKGAQYVGWLKQRASAAGLRISDRALAFLASQNIGNLHNASQEIEKLALYYDNEEVDYRLLIESAADGSHYESFALSDSALKGDAAGCRRILRLLRMKEVPPYLIVSTLSGDLRKLWLLSKGSSPNWEQLGAQSFRRPLFSQALARFQGANRKRLLQLLVMAALADRAAKGATNADVWQLLEGISLRIAAAASPALLHLKVERIWG